MASSTDAEFRKQMANMSAAINRLGTDLNATIHIIDETRKNQDDLRIFVRETMADRREPPDPPPDYSYWQRPQQPYDQHAYVGRQPNLTPQQPDPNPSSVIINDAVNTIKNILANLLESIPVCASNSTPIDDMANTVVETVVKETLLVEPIVEDVKGDEELDDAMDYSGDVVAPSSVQIIEPNNTYVVWPSKLNNPSITIDYGDSNDFHIGFSAHSHKIDNDFSDLHLEDKVYFNGGGVDTDIFIYFMHELS